MPMMWTTHPESVLVLKRHADHNVNGPFCQLTRWLAKEVGVRVYVEAGDLSDKTLEGNPQFQNLKNDLLPFGDCESIDGADVIDLVICMGGDRTVLHASSLFQGPVPLVMAFSVGMPGFLAPFQLGPDLQQSVSEVIEGSPRVFLRHRLACVVTGGEGGPCVGNSSQLEESRRLVLNEVVVSRGPTCTLSSFDIYIGSRLVTSVLGDGLIVSSPTGSTAYSVSAGASMVHPSIPCVMVTPICPHSLSFRPVIVPAGVSIKVKPCGENTESTCMVCFDGRERIEMTQGQILQVTTASHPMPSICSMDQTQDWFDSLATCLNWNTRRLQKPMEKSPENDQRFITTTTTLTPPPTPPTTAPSSPSSSPSTKPHLIPSSTPLSSPPSTQTLSTKTKPQKSPRLAVTKSSHCVKNNISTVIETCHDEPLGSSYHDAHFESSFHDSSDDTGCRTLTNTSSKDLSRKCQKYGEEIRHQNAFNSLTTNLTKPLDLKDINHNDLMYLTTQTDNHRVLLRKSNTNSHCIVNSPDLNPSAGYVNYDSNSKYKVVYSVLKDVPEQPLGIEKEICDRKLLDGLYPGCNESLTTQSSAMFTDDVNSTAIDTDKLKKDADNYIKSVSSFIMDKEIPLAASTIIT